MRTAKSIRSRLAALALILATLAFPTSLLACSACFGRSDSPMAKGMNMGILSLLGVVLAVLAGIAAFFIFLMIRSARLAAAAASTSDLPVRTDPPPSRPAPSTP